MKEFIKHNKEFWSRYENNSENTEKILIEEPSYLPIVHVNSLFAVALNKAKGYSPVWMHNEACQDIELLKSYVPSSKIIKNRNLSFFKKVYILIVSILKFIQLYFTKDIINFKYDGVKYGDIIYDAYLTRHKLATIKKIKPNLIIPIILCIYRHIEIKNILKSDNFKGVLVSHQIGINSGVMLRVALRYGYEGYLRCGHHQATFQFFTNPDEVYNYEYKPLPSEVDEIIKKYGDKLNDEYEKVLEIQTSGKGSKDGMTAFSKKNKWYKDRQSFNADHKLKDDKKNIFIMLHAFNDNPHSHFRWMLFKDYYDWFEKTLEFAKKNEKVNWIFKQHPSIKWYPMKDVDMKKLFENCPDNITYIDEDKQIDTRSLISCADMVVTCLGSVGFELPAMGAVPSLTASDNFYHDLGFALEPKTQNEYFDILNKTENIEKLTKKQQQRARAAFIYIYRQSRVNISAAPILSMAEEKNINLHDWYYDRVEKKYKDQKDIIISEMDKYIKEIKKPNFKKLNSL